MARTGISYEEVARAAEQLKAEGKNDTIENVRFITGTGSSTTIAMHLRNWRNNNIPSKSVNTEEILPESIVLTMKGLWAHVIQEARDQVEPIKQNLEQTVAELKVQLQTLQENNAHLQQQYQQLKQENEKLDHETIDLKQLIHQLENEKIAMAAIHEGLLKQLHDKQVHIDELNRLNQQNQTNLEQYLETSREQRIIDEQRHQQVQLQLEQAIAKINQKLMRVTQDNTLLQQQNQQFSFEKNNFETQIAKLNEHNISMASKLAESLNEMTKISHAKQHLRDLYQTLSLKWEEQNKLFLELQTQHALLLHETTAIKASAKEIAEQNKILAHEKWILGQEKAQLYGAHKQLQEIRGINEDKLHV